MTNNLQPTYGERISPAVAGLIKGPDFNTITGVCETVAGLGFGIAVSQGSGDQGVVIGGTRAGFLGITVRDVTLESVQADVISRYQNLSVLQRGQIWVAPSHSVVAGDAVYFVAATGVLTNQSSGNQGPINGARFVTSAAGTGDLAVVELSGYMRSA